MIDHDDFCCGFENESAKFVNDRLAIRLRHAGWPLGSARIRDCANCFSVIPIVNHNVGITIVNHPFGNG